MLIFILFYYYVYYYINIVFGTYCIIHRVEKYQETCFIVEIYNFYEKIKNYK